MNIETPPTEKPYEKPEGERRGLVIVNTGDGKGKSTAAFGLAFRATGRGKAVKVNCDAGCIGCGLCAKNCPKDAITFANNIAKIDYEKCVGCGLCAAKCPAKVIVKA